MKAFAAQNGLSFYLADGVLIILTPYSKWKIIIKGSNKRIYLYHKNTLGKEEQEPLIPGYHHQAVRRGSIMGYLEYIIEHDRYRLNNPVHIKRKKKAPPKKGTKRYKQAQEKMKRIERYQSIRRVIELIDSLSG